MKILNNKLIQISLVFLLLFLMFYLFCFNSIKIGEVGITKNLFTNEINIQEAGYYITPPYIIETTIDTKPIRVCIESTARIKNCRLVQFNSLYYEEFVKMQGYYYYWWSNRVSYNYAYENEYRGFKEIMRGYAFSPPSIKPNFIIILEEY